MTKKKKGCGPGKHDYVKKWDGAFKRCKKCGRAMWWWECNQMWKRTMPGIFLALHPELKRDVCSDIPEGEEYAPTDGFGDIGTLPVDLNQLNEKQKRELEKALEAEVIDDDYADLVEEFRNRK